MRWWVKSVLTHPLAYIEHRAVFAFTLLRHMSPIEYGKSTNHIELERLEGPLPSANPLDQTRYKPDSSDEVLRCQSAIGERAGEIVPKYSKLQMFLPWEDSVKFLPFGVIENLVFNRVLIILSPFVCALVLAWKIRKRAPGDVLVAVSAAVGLGNFLMLVFFGVASDGRYMLPTVVSAFVCALAILKTPERLKIRGVLASLLDRKTAFYRPHAMTQNGTAPASSYLDSPSD